MPRGPKPKPTALKLIRGTDRAARRNPAESRLPPAMPDPPSHLSPEAQAEWHRVTDQLYAAGILTSIDRAALGACCQAYGRWVEAEDALARMAGKDAHTAGLMIRTQGGNAIQNPLVGTANKAMADMMRYAAEFGMTPSARTRIHAEAAAFEADDPAAEFFGA